jgi:Ca-activated chloride channel homolog
VLAVGLLAALTGDGAAQAPAAQEQVPAFRAGIDVVSLNVTVTGPDGRYVTGLEAGDFTVYEDGVKQELAYFNKANLPLGIALLLDSSASMEERMATAQEAAIGFARQLRPQDLAELLDFDSRVEVLQGFTSDATRLEQAIRKTTAGGSTSLFNALYISLKDLKKIQAQSLEDVRRQAIIVLSDGEDTSSLVTYEQVLDIAKHSDTAIYAIGLRAREGEGASRGFHEAEYVLRELTRETGGRVFFPQKVEELSGIYAQISDELSSQYLVGYSSRNPRRDGAWRRIVVRVNRENAAARTKQGYYGPTSQ